MTNFEGPKELFNVLKRTKHIPKNWNDFVSWGIIESMNELLLDSIQNVVVVANFLYVSVDEAIAINNTS
jgi:hypothetical protein